MRRRDQRGQAMVEFALVSIALFLAFFVLMDVLRMMQINSTVSEAARQGARQAAANANAADSPFVAASGNCSGQVFTASATGTGCLTDAAVKRTVQAVLGTTDTAITLYSNTSAADCPNPAVAAASVCVTPSETAGAGSYASCAAARSALGRDPQPGDLGGRAAEWAKPQYQGCYLVMVTVVYAYQGMTPALNLDILPFLKISSTSAILAEY